MDIWEWEQEALRSTTYRVLPLPRPGSTSFLEKVAAGSAPSSRLAVPPVPAESKLIVLSTQAALPSSGHADSTAAEHDDQSYAQSRSKAGVVAPGDFAISLDVTTSAWAPATTTPPPSGLTLVDPWNVSPLRGSSSPPCAALGMLVDPWGAELPS